MPSDLRSLFYFHFNLSNSYFTIYILLVIGPESDHFIGYACHSLPNSLTNSLLFSGLDGCQSYHLLDDIATATESCESFLWLKKVV